MGRRSLVEFRREELLTSISLCIAKFGLAGSTQEVIARETGYSRSHIRHYLGNRDDVIALVWEHITGRYLSRIDEIAAIDPPDEALDQLVEYLFGPDMAPQPDDLALEAVMREAVNHPVLRDKVHRTYVHTIGTTTRLLEAAIPGISADEGEQTAFSLWSLAVGAAYYSDMAFAQSQRHATRSTAHFLIDRLRMPAAAPGREGQ